MLYARLDNKSVSEEQELQLVFSPLYLEPMLVINDRDTNPTRHEFYIRLFICARSVSPRSRLRDESVQLWHER